MEKQVSECIQGEEFIFDYRRVIYWPKHRLLIGTDLHWGKAQFLRSNGISISDAVFDADLDRLSDIFHDYDVRTFLVLGDLIHHEEALKANVISKITNFRHIHPCELVLVKGNHDRYVNFPDSWGIVEESHFYIDDFAFHHEHVKGETGFQFSGHVHPMLRLRLGPDMLRLPSFLIGERFCLLPAYSHLTGGQDIRPAKGQKAIALTDDGLEVFVKIS